MTILNSVKKNIPKTFPVPFGLSVTVMGNIEFSVLCKPLAWKKVSNFVYVSEHH